MALGVEDSSRSNLDSDEFIVAEFGRVELDWFDLSKKYRGALFRLNPETIRQVSEILGFSANFDLPAIRSGTIDLFDTQGHIVLEIERNTKPTDIAIRYSRDRWQLLETSSKSAENLRPWIRTEYKANFISEKLIGLVAEQLKFSPDKAGHFVIRLNFREKIFGLIAQEIHAEQMPGGGFSYFSLPNEAMLAIATKYKLKGSEATLAPVSEPDRQIDPQEIENKETAIASAGKKDSKEQAKPEASTVANTKQNQSTVTQSKPEGETQVESSSAKYATYSRSEVDQMLKQHAETIANALGSKISSQQRVFQDAVEKQEKAFAKISDGFTSAFDQTRSRLEGMSKQSEETVKAELEHFKKELSRELEQHRAQINKTVMPVAKFIDERNARPVEKEKGQDKKEKEPTPVKANQAGPGELVVLKPLLITNLVLVLIVIGALFAVVMPDIARIQDLEKQIQELNYKLKSMPAANGSAGNLSGAQPAQSSPVSSSGSN